MFYGFNVDVNMAKRAQITTGWLTAALGTGDAALQHHNQANKRTPVLTRVMSQTNPTRWLPAGPVDPDWRWESGIHFNLI